MGLEQLLQGRADIWRGDQGAAALPPGLASGFPELDARLPGGGWPAAALSEILSDSPGAFALALPLLARLSREGRRLLLAAPPYIPYAPALAGWGVDLGRLVLVRVGEAEALWAAEQGLCSGACGLVLLWAEPRDTGVLRRLQLAAETGAAPALLFRGEAAAARPSPAALRLRARPGALGSRAPAVGRAGLEVEVLKCRGALCTRTPRCLV
jgi:hypothetical protein